MRQIITPKLSELSTNGLPSQRCWEYNSILAKVVVSKCFLKYLDYFDRGDLEQMAVSDAAWFSVKLADTNKEEDIRNLRNVLFTRMRNTISNHIFKCNKTISTEDDVLDKQTISHDSIESSSETVSEQDFDIASLNDFRDITLRVWKMFKKNGEHPQYTITADTDDIKEWETYSEVRNMKTPCDLITCYDSYTEEEIEALAESLDGVTGQNYFSTLYQLLGDKFLMFLDVFQEDAFSIPSTTVVKHILSAHSIIQDHEDGLTVEQLSAKYDRSVLAINKILASKDVI